MNDQRKKMWDDLVTVLLGEEWMDWVKRNPSEPDLSLQQEDTILGDTVDEEERYIYSILPSGINGQKFPPTLIELSRSLWQLWWSFIAFRHHIQGPIGIRKGWMLVAPKPLKEPLISGIGAIDDVDELMEHVFGRKGKMIVVGRFERKGENEKKDKDYLS